MVANVMRLRTFHMQTAKDIIIFAQTTTTATMC